jgi:hypothetical protein
MAHFSHPISLLCPMRYQAPERLDSPSLWEDHQLIASRPSFYR